MRIRALNPTNNLALHGLLGMYSQTVKAKAALEPQESLLNNILGPVYLDGFPGILDVVAYQYQPAGIGEFTFNYIFTDSHLVSCHISNVE
jgi:hypothetical protein